MSSIRNITRKTSRAVGICCLLLPIFLAARNSDGEERNGPKPADSIGLNYFSASWNSVLQDVAGTAGAQLVAPDLPAARYSRLDRKKYSLDDAVRILNAELEPQGYRILVKPPYLIVVDVPSTRMRYPPAVVSMRESSTGEKVSGNENPFANQGGLQRLPPVESEHGSADYPVRLASHLAPTEKVATPANDLRQSGNTRFRIAVQSQEAAAVANRMYQACKPNAAAIARGPQELPVFRFGGTAPATSFIIAVDQQRNELLIESPPTLTTSVTSLIRKFDTFAAQPNEMTRVVTTAGNAGGTAQRLRAPLARLAAAQVDLPAPRTLLAQPVQLAQQPNVADQPAEPRPRDLPALIAELKGDVSVEVLEDLGVLVISGNKDDVEAVVAIVREMEKLGVGAAPEVHILLLRHVNSEAMSELLSGVYQRLETFGGPARAGQNVALMPVVKPNAVLIVASQADMPSILKLADELDQPVAPSSQFRVFQLKAAVASQVLAMVEKFYEPRGGLAARIKTVVDDRTNAIVVQGSPRDLAEVAALIQKIDLDESNAVNQMRLIPLQNAVAEELSLVINTAIQSVLFPNAGGGPGGLGGLGGAGAGGAASQPSDSARTRQVQVAKSVVLQFLTTENGAQRAVRSGILEDIRVSFDARTNSLVVTAPRQSMQMMAELIRQLDMPTSLVADIKVFSLANSDAAAMIRLLENLYNTQAQAREQQALVAGAADASSNLIPLRLSVDVRTNSIIAKGAPETLRVVEAILLRLDESDLRQRQSVVYRLKNSPAVDVASAINQFLTSQRSLAQLDPNLVSTVELLEREVIVVPEPVSNSLLISSTPRYFDEIQALTKKLDEAPAQVVIQALLVEVELNKNDEFGVELGVQDSVLFDRSVINNLVTLTETLTAPNGVQTTTQRLVSQESQPGFLFNNTPLGNNTAVRPSSVGNQGLSNFGVGRVNGDLGYGGLVLSAGSESLSVLIRALAARRNVNILSRPQIRTLDNQLAQIQVGQQVPIVDGVVITGTGSANPQIRQDQAGIILTVTPRVSPEGIIVMEVIAEKSQFTGRGVPIFTDANTGNVIESPVKDITTARTTVSVPNAQTIVLGGMITNIDSKNERKVPWLGDLPILKHLFRFNSVASRRTELLIFLTPRIIRNDLESELIKQVETGRIHFMQQEAEAIHGPLFAVPDEEAEMILPGTPTFDE
jgi:general secretion pathway protein D